MKKSLQDLNMLDRFLFAEALEDPETMRLILEIILDKEILLKYLPHVEKELRTSPSKRFVKLDVWAQDEEGTIYDTEVQNQDTGNLIKRSRFYQSLIDSSLLKSGEVDFNKLANAFIILIAPFDLFGNNQYVNSFQMFSNKEPKFALGDGAVRIFLNTHGTDDENITPELKELLLYMEHSDSQTSNNCSSERIHQLHNKIQAIKDNEEVGVKYMQEWEEKIIMAREATAKGMAEGMAKGRVDTLKALVSKKLAKGMNANEIADILEEDLDTIQHIIMELDKGKENNQ